MLSLHLGGTVTVRASLTMTENSRGTPRSGTRDEEMVMTGVQDLAAGGNETAGNVPGSTNTGRRPGGGEMERMEGRGRGYRGLMGNPRVGWREGGAVL